MSEAPTPKDGASPLTDEQSPEFKRLVHEVFLTYEISNSPPVPTWAAVAMQKMAESIARYRVSTAKYDETFQRLTADLAEARAQVAVLVDAAEDVYAESAGPADDGEKHCCHGCGVDLSMRGMAEEVEEHHERCEYGKLAKAVRDAPTSAVAFLKDHEEIRKEMDALRKFAEITSAAKERLSQRVSDAAQTIATLTASHRITSDAVGASLSISASVSAQIGALKDKLAQAERERDEAQSTLRKRAMISTDNAIIDRMSFCERMEAAESALQPFAQLGAELGDGVMEGVLWPDDTKIEGAKAYSNGKDYFITVGDLRRAAKALHPNTPESGKGENIHE